ncbi:mitochondrial hypoxia responsive domain-containing protein [Diaporthe helianthi]|uniref:Mitochondrial hypoxia responsive domain-containing protein n=1 Tax=Diaporthe helianthi TaxID=158607 RepID=A0A2P5HPM8_DIAHE|nr:mitochondrial hypoxia responsive domain-containing protein [Diaporthe helianthi]
MTSPVSGRPLPSSFDENDEFYNESGLQKVLGRMKREPLVPLGCLLTVAAFTNAYRAMRKGDHNQVQRMFRARVIAQGFTVAAMVAGGLYFGAERHKERENWKLQEQEKAEEKRQKWIRELEARDDEEKELKAMMIKRREKKKTADAEATRDSFRAAEAKRLNELPPAPHDKVNNQSSNWGLGWLGRSRDSNTQNNPTPDDKSNPNEQRK